MKNKYLYFLSRFSLDCALRELQRDLLSPYMYTWRTWSVLVSFIHGGHGVSLSYLYMEDMECPCLIYTRRKWSVLVSFIHGGHGVSLSHLYMEDIECPCLIYTWRTWSVLVSFIKFNKYKLIQKMDMYIYINTRLKLG